MNTHNNGIHSLEKVEKASSLPFNTHKMERTIWL